LEKRLPTGEILYFLRFLFFPSNLHTVEVTGSNPVSPTILLSTTCVIPIPGKMAGVPKTVPEFGENPLHQNRL
jgi:hypothetical protein